MFNLIFHLICAFISKWLLCFPSQNTQYSGSGNKEKQEEEKGAFLNDFFKQVQNDYNTKMAPIF